MYVDILSTCMSTFHVCAWYILRLEVVAGPLERELEMVVRHHMVLGIEPQPSGREVRAFKHRASLQP